MIKVTQVQPDSIADELGLRPGTELISVNGRELDDFLDWQFLTADEEFTLHIRQPDGAEIEFEIERPLTEPLGVAVEAARIRRCANRCDFCFVDGLPEGLRDVLYIRDDDYRLSFQYGNFATLTNLKPADQARIIEYRLSPLYVSVHATDPVIRRWLLRNPTAPDILEQLQHFADHGIRFHTQIVMSPGVNDGAVMDRTLSDLYAFGAPILGVSIVPVGLTEFSKHSRVREPTTEECRAAVRQLTVWQERALRERGAPWVYGADELYLRADLPLPPESSYGEFEQVENGVGSVRFLQRRIREDAGLFGDWAGRRIGVVTGTSMGRLMPQVLTPLEQASGARLELIVVSNGLFGPRVTTAGLLPGKSIAESLAGRNDLDLILLPGESLNDDHLFIDNVSADQLAAAVPVPLRFSKDFSDALEAGSCRVSKPTVAIVGRPNVGKSTLFNRILGGRAAIVSEHAGTTRDRHFGEAEWAGRTFWLVDTGGLVPDSNVTMDRAIRQQVDLALAEADLILFVVDGREGLNPVDQAVAEKLRRARRPVLLAVNKLDQGGDQVHAHEFHTLGFGDPQAVSATVGTRSGDLLDAIVEKLPPAGDDEKEPTVDIAIVGRPNAGKSSLANRLLGTERYVVDAVAGTTRDAVDSMLRYQGKVIRFIDTAGLRRAAKVEDDVEFYSTLRTKRAIEQAAVCILVVDAALGLHNQDLRIATEAWDQGAGLVIAVNKWDLIEEKDANTARRGEEQLIAKAPFLQYVPFVYISSLTGQRTRKVLDVALEVAEAREHRINTSEVNKVLEALIQRQQPPQKQGEEVKLVYASQIGTSPPAFAIVSNRPDDVPESYQRYLMHGFRSAWGFTGAPVRLKFALKSGRR